MGSPKFANPPLTIKKTPVSSKKFEERSLSFCFEHASLLGGLLCFDNKHQESSDIIKLISCLKQLGKTKISDLQDNNSQYHFHNVDFTSDRGYLKDIFKKAIGYKGTLQQLPALYSIEIFTDSKRQIAPRLVFYIHTDAVAKVVYLDYHHLLFSKLYGTKTSIPATWFEHYPR